jgi:alcohol dehydrogenase class IV
MTSPVAFDFALDTEIRFGRGRRREVGSVAGGIGPRAVLFTGRSFDTSPHGAEIRDALAAAHVEVVDEIVSRGEPDDEMANAAADHLRESRAVVVIAVGGGSTIDLAKAAGLVAGGATLEQLLLGELVAAPIGPAVIALPTTAGTGAEVSRGAILLHRSAARKRAIRGRGVAPRVAIVDPELGATAGPEVTAAAGFDAVAHALETAVSRVASDINVALAADALARLLVSVPRAMAAPDNIDARSEAAYAALLMGINLATSSTCLPHRLQYALASMTEASHARGVAAITPAWLERTRPFAAERLDELATRAGLSEPGAPGVAADRLVERIGAWMDEIGMRIRLSSLGLTQDQIPDLVSRVEGTLANDPGPTTPGDLEALTMASL